MRSAFKVSLASAALALAAFGASRSQAGTITLIDPGTNTQSNSGAVVAGNGNFDQSPLGSNSFPSSVPGWTATGGNFQYNPAGNDNGNYSAPNIYAVNVGTSGITLSSVPSGAAMPYSYSTNAGDVFTLSYWAADNHGAATGTQLNVTADLVFGSNTYTVIPLTGVTSQNYTQFTGTYTAGSADVGQTPVVELLLNNTSSNDQLQVDSVGLSVASATVPEPATLGLLTVGAAGLLLKRKKALKSRNATA
jgi:hypothetical protein